MYIIKHGIVQVDALLARLKHVPQNLRQGRGLTHGPLFARHRAPYPHARRAGRHAVQPYHLIRVPPLQHIDAHAHHQGNVPLPPTAHGQVLRHIHAEQPRFGVTGSTLCRPAVPLQIPVCLAFVALPGLAREGAHIRETSP